MVWACEQSSGHDERTHLADGADKMIPSYALHKPFTVSLPDRSEWDRGIVPIRNGGSSGVQMGPRQIKELEPRCMAMVLGRDPTSA
jgi:hypothetical protein